LQHKYSTIELKCKTFNFHIENELGHGGMTMSYPLIRGFPHRRGASLQAILGCGLQSGHHTMSKRFPSKNSRCADDELGAKTVSARPLRGKPQKHSTRSTVNPKLAAIVRYLARQSAEEYLAETEAADPTKERVEDTS
jgi:hypothetical protein